MLKHVEMTKFIRATMQDQRISERFLCLQAGVNRSCFRRYMAGNSDMGVYTLSRLLSALGYRFTIKANKAGKVK